MSEKSGVTPDTYRTNNSELPEVVNVSSVDRDAITERIIDRVIDAAEHDEPIERTYELGNERKDDPGPGYQPMQSVGAILQEKTKPAATYEMPKPSEEQISNARLSDDSSYDSSKKGSHNFGYKNAVKYGFIAAIVVAVVVAVAVS